MKKYETVTDIIEAYYPIRYDMYTKRKAYMIKQLKKIVKILHNKARFIEEQCDGTIDLRRKKKEEVKSGSATIGDLIKAEMEKGVED